MSIWDRSKECWLHLWSRSTSHQPQACSNVRWERHGGHWCVYLLDRGPRDSLLGPLAIKDRVQRPLLPSKTTSTLGLESNRMGILCSAQSMLFRGTCLLQASFSKLFWIRCANILSWMKRSITFQWIAARFTILCPFLGLGYTLKCHVWDLRIDHRYCRVFPICECFAHFRNLCIIQNGEWTVRARAHGCSVS